MKFELIEAKKEDINTVKNLMQLYTYELSFYEDETTNFKLLENGLYAMSKYIDLYWTEEKRNPFLLKCDGELAGFVLQRLNEKGLNEIGEFFVLNRYRKIGAGKFMAKWIFEKYKGKWEVRVLLKNERAQGFWRKVISEVSKGKFEEKLIRGNSRYAFYFEN